MHRLFCVTLRALVSFALVSSLAIGPACAGVLDGLGAVGGGSSGPAPTNFPDLLQTHRGLNFGGVGIPYAKGVVGADSSEILAPGNQIDQIITNVTAGDVTLAIITIGDNDYIDVATEIADGTLSGAALAAHQQQVATNIATAVNAVKAAGGAVVLGGFANITDSPAAAGIKADPVQRARLQTALADGRTLVSDFVVAQGIPFIDFFALQKEVYEAGSAQIGGVDLILDGFDSDPHYFFKDPFHAGILVRGAITNLYIEAINQGFGTNIPLLSDLEILALAGLEGEYVEETFADQYAYPAYVAVPEPTGFVLAGAGVVGVAFVSMRRKRRFKMCR